MYKAGESVIKTIFTHAKQNNYAKQWFCYRHMFVVDQLLSAADEKCRKDAMDQTKLLHANIHCVSPNDIIDTISQYEGIKELLNNSVTHMQQIGETSYKNNRYNLINTSIVYSDHWCPPSIFTCSPYHIHSKKHSEQVIKDWYASALGNSLSSSMEEKLWQLKPAEWSAFLQPYAANNYVELMGQFLSIFVLIDDYFVEGEATKAQNITSEQLLLFAETWKLASERKTGHQTGSKRLAMEIHDIALKTNNNLLEPCFHLWSVVADNYVKLGADEAWCNRMSKAIEEWIILGIKEAIGNEHIKQLSLSTDSLFNLPANFISSEQTTSADMNGISILKILMRQRVSTIGVPMISLLLEQSCGINLTSVDPLLRPLISVLSMITVLVNELLGMAKDLKGEPNFLLAYRQIFDCSLEQSIHFTITLHDLAIKIFDQKVTEIIQSLELSSSQHHISIFIERLRVLARGYAQWHHNADRYKTLIALDENYRQLFLFSVADGKNERYNALQEALQQYKLNTTNT